MFISHDSTQFESIIFRHRENCFSCPVFSCLSLLEVASSRKRELHNGENIEATGENSSANTKYDIKINYLVIGFKAFFCG